MALPTNEEKQAIQQFRTRVSDILQKEQLEDDWFLIRWLRARDLNLDKAETILRNSMKWRSENKVDQTLSKHVDPYFKTNFPFDVSGRDREGRLLLIMPMGKWDVKKAVDDGKLDEMVHYINYFFESVMQAIKDSSKDRPAEHPHTQFSCIVDWDGYSFRQLANIKAAQTVLKISAVYEAHYPEVLANGIFINTTSVFQILWNLMKKILAEKTVGKLQVFGTNRTEWEQAIRKIADPGQIKYEFKEGRALSDEEFAKLKEAHGISEEEIIRM